MNAVSRAISTAPLTYEVLEVPIARIRPFAFQPRKWFNPEEIRARSESLKASGQQCAVTVEPIYDDPDHDYELVDGESRLRSAKEAGFTTLWAMVRSRPFACRTDKHLASLVANFNRSEHTPMEISDALHVQVTEGGKTQLELAQAIGRQQYWICDYLSLQKLHQNLKLRLHPSTHKTMRLSPAVGFELARLSPEQQMQAAQGGDGRVTLLRVQIEVERLLGAPRTRRATNPARRRERLLSAVRSAKADLVKLQRLLQDSSGDERQAIKEGIAEVQLHSSMNHWSPEREARYRALHEQNPQHVAHLRAGITEFRQLLENRYGRR